MKFLGNIFKRRPAIERVEALTRIFRYSRPEDIAKIFELGRIEALNILRRDLYYFIGVVGSLVTIFGFIFIPKYIDSIVDSRVEREIDKRIDKFSNFYAYSKEVIPIMEYDFYRIKSVKTTLQIKNNQIIQTLLNGWQLSPQFNLSAKLISNKGSVEFLSWKIDRRDTEALHDSDFIWSEQKYDYLINKQIDIFQDFNFLEIKISMGIDPSQYLEPVLREFSEKLDTYIDSIDKIEIETYVNKVRLYKSTVRRGDLKKVGDFEYLYTINWRDIFESDGSAKKLYIRLVGSEQRKN